jgi:hypothetical protein
MRRAIRIFRLSALGVLLAAASAQTQTPPQAPPSTDIFLLDLKQQGARVSAGKPVNITSRPGYDNQPMFVDGGRSILYTSIREDGQADIYKYDVASGGRARITRTKESEYSPTVMPGGRFISVVRVEPDSTQRLWKFPIEGGAQPSLVLEAVKPVGYHAWIDAQTVAVFILGQPSSLQLVDLRTDKAERVAESVGRSLHIIPRQGRLSFVHKVADKEWWIKSLDLKTRKVTPLVKTLSGSEDFAWLPEGVLLMASGSKLFKLAPASESDWQEVADFSQAGIRAITRLAVSPKGDKMAVVASTDSKP